MAETADSGDPADTSDGSREDLLALGDDYVAAMVANDPGAVPIVEDATFVENLQRKTPGRGLWETATATPDSFEIHVPDPVAGQLGYLGLMEEGDEPILLGLRLAVEDGVITEMEHLIARDLQREGVDTLSNLQTPRPAFRERVDPSERTTRKEMLEIGAAYYDALIEDDGSLAP